VPFWQLTDGVNGVQAASVSRQCNNSNVSEYASSVISHNFLFSNGDDVCRQLIMAAYLGGPVLFCFHQMNQVNSCSGCMLTICDCSAINIRPEFLALALS